MKGEWFCLPLDGQLAIKLSQRVVNIFKQWIQLTYNYSPFKTIISLISHACSIHIHVKYSYSQFKYLKIKNLRKTKEFYLDFQRCKARGNVLNCKLMVGSGGGGGGIATYIAIGRPHGKPSKTWAWATPSQGATREKKKFLLLLRFENNIQMGCPNFTRILLTCYQT